MRVSRQDCDRIIELDLKRAHGITLATDEIEFYRDHLEKCPDCKKEAAALGAIAEEGNPGALPELDDLSKRRLIEDVIAKADEQLMFFNEEPLPLHTDHRRSPIATIALAATLAAASIVAVLVWKPFSADAAAPKWIRRRKKPGKTAGKVTVSAFVNGWCPVQNLVYERARRAAAQFGEKVLFQSYDTLDREVFEQWGISDGLYIDGKEVRTGPPPSYEKIAGLIEKRVRRLR